MREFILYSRTGRTDTNWTNLHDAGRLDVVYECIIASLFLSHGIRKDAVFHAILNGPTSPPTHLQIEGQTLHDVRTDQQTWTTIMKKILSGKQHSGMITGKTSFEALVKTRVNTNPIYVLEEDGQDINAMEIGVNPIFILGDHIGLPKTVERYTLRYGQKISLGKQPYLAATCIAIINYVLDQKPLG